MTRIIQVGMGGWGQSWAATVLRPAQNGMLVACVDEDPAALAAARKRLDISAELCFTDLNRALEAIEADAVLVTASLPGHVPAALAALEAGKHVLLEKPFAPTVVEAQSVVEAAAAAGRVLMISQNYRFYPAVVAVTRLVQEEALGAVAAVTLDFRRYSNSAPVEGHRHYHIAQPLLMDMSIHHFDLMRAVLGQEATWITCHTSNPPWSNFVEPAAAFATITFDGGTVVSYRGSWVSPGVQTAWAGEWHMECARGEIAWTSRDGSGIEGDSVTLRPLGKRARRVKLPKLPFVDRAGSLNAFVTAIRDGQEPPSSGRDNLGTVALMWAAVEASNAPLSLAVAPPSHGYGAMVPR